MTNLASAINSSDLEFTSLKASALKHFELLLNPIFENNVGFLGYTEPKSSGASWCNVAIVDPTYKRFCLHSVFRAINVEIAISTDPDKATNIFTHDALVDLVMSTLIAFPVNKFNASSTPGTFYSCAIPDWEPLFITGEHEMVEGSEHPYANLNNKIRTTILLVSYSFERTK